MPQKKSIKHIIRRKSAKRKTQKKRTNTKMLKKGGAAIDETDVKLYFYPRTSAIYKEKNGFNKDTLQNGKFMVMVDKRYGSMGNYFTESLNQTDDFIANLLNGCSNGYCTEGKVAVEPYFVKTIKVKDEKKDKKKG
jgi:hypothetical protein